MSGYTSAENALGHEFLRRLRELAKEYGVNVYIENLSPTMIPGMRKITAKRHNCADAVVLAESRLAIGENRAEQYAENIFWTLKSQLDCLR